MKKNQYPQYEMFAYKKVHIGHWFHIEKYAKIWYWNNDKKSWYYTIILYHENVKKGPLDLFENSKNIRIIFIQDPLVRWCAAGQISFPLEIDKKHKRMATLNL